MLIRHAAPTDYAAIIAVIDAWWGGRAMSAMVPRLFFARFRPTSFVAEQPHPDTGSSIVGFLCGFVSETDPTDAYIHFVGVDPTERGSGAGRRLYERFFEEARALGCERVGCVTGPVNGGSIAFHTAMGFSSRLVPHYDGLGNDRVVFSRELGGSGSPRPDAVIDGIAAAHRRLLATLERDEWDPAAPSLLPGWSIAHVVTHLARNADGIAGLFVAAARGEEGRQYPGGREQRAADIEAGLARSREELIDDVRRAGAAVEYQLAIASDDVWRTGVGHSVFGPDPIAAWPYRRWREVEIHHVDLGLSFVPDDWSAGFLERDWTAQVTELADRLPAGVGCRLLPIDDPELATDVAGSGTIVRARRRDLLGWMLGRTTIEGAPELRSAG